MRIWQKVGLGVLGLAALGGISKQFQEKPAPPESPAGRQADAGAKSIQPGPPDNASILSEHARDTLKIVRQTAELDGFGSVMKSTLAIKNTNPFAVKDFTVICAQFAPSGTELPATTATIYEILRPSEIRTFHNVSFGFVSPAAKEYRCFVGTARLADERR